MTVLLVILLLALAVGYPYLSAVFLRSRMLRRLERTCRDCGFRFRPLRSFFWFVRNRGGRYDLIIENKTQVFAVKLWSAYRRDGILVITEKGRVFVRRYAPILLDVRRDAKEARADSRQRPVCRTVTPLSEKDRRPLTKILLVYPSYRAILRQDKGEELPLKSGDVAFDKTILTPSALEKLLRERGEGSESQP